MAKQATKNKVKLENDVRIRAATDPSSYNETDGTIEVVWSTGMRYKRHGWDGPYFEELSMEDSAVRLERLNAGASFLDNHNSYGSVAKVVLGRVVRAWIKDGEGRAVVKLSQREDLAGVRQDIKDGVLGNISVQYRIWDLELVEGGDGDIPVYRATDWEPFEISLVTVPVDYESTTRSADNRSESEFYQLELRNILEKNSQNKNKLIMNRDQIIAILGKRGISVDANATDEQLLEVLERSLTTPAAAPAAAPVANAPAAENQLTEQERAALTQFVERERSTMILEATRMAGLSAEFAEGLVKDGKTIEEARAAIQTEWSKTQSPAPTRYAGVIVLGGNEQEQARAAAMADAIVLRSDPTIVLEDSRTSAAREFRGMSLLRMAEEHLRLNQVETRGLSAREIAEKALATRSMSTSDFPIILGNTVNRQLRAAYDEQERTFMPFTRRASAKDFKQLSRVQLSGMMDSFEEVKEGGEYKNTSLDEAREVYQVAKYGRIIPITWETIINDDLDAFSRIPRIIANKAAQKQSDIVWGIITGNPNMADGEALFSTAHSNIAASGTDLTTDALSAARAAMRKQKGIENDYINVMPKFLIVGPDRETKAQQIINAAIVATKATDTNVFKASMQIIVDPRITGNQWYLAASPSAIDTIEYAFLDGEQELFTETKYGFEVDGLQIKARMVFGAKAIDWRGMYKNAGN